MFFTESSKPQECDHWRFDIYVDDPSEELRCRLKAPRAWSLICRDRRWAAGKLRHI